MQVTATVRRGGLKACLRGAVLAGGVAAGAAAEAEAEQITNRFLGDACAGRFPDAVIGIARKSLCAGVIIGVVLTHALAVETRQAVPAFCPDTPEVDPRELSDNYLDLLAEHPERLEQPAIEGMVAMLALRYPCPR